MPLRLYAAGSNARGQLASGDCEDQYIFSLSRFTLFDCDSSLLPAGTRVLSLACGSNHTLVLLETHDHQRELWGCGDSTRGQLPGIDGSTQFQRLSCGIPDGYSLTGVAACWETSFVTATPTDIDKSDIVLSFGANDFGDRGVDPNGTIIDFQSAISLSPAVVRVRELATGPHHVVATLDVHSMHDAEPISVLVGWGACRHGQLGANIPKAPVAKSSRPRGPQIAQMVDKPIHIATYRDQDSRPRRLAAGSQHTLVLHSSGRITSLGSSRRGQLGLPNDVIARDVGCNWTSSVVVSDLGRIYACGNSNHGQLGRGSSGGVEFGPVSFAASVNELQIQQLACGSEHSLVVVGGEVWAWGWNEHGNLGVGHTEDVREPIRVWPFSGTPSEGERVVQIWAGCGTSWILAESDNAQNDSSS